MNNKLMTVLGAICGVIVLVIAGEWLYANFSRQQLLNMAPPKEKQALADKMPGIDLSEHNEDSYTDLVDRPLFIEGRKPAVEVTPEAAKTVDVDVKFEWVLYGVYTTTKGLSALLARPPSMKSPKHNHRRITVGELLDGWKLAEIKSDRVVFTQDDVEKPLLLHKAKPKQITKPGNPPPPQGRPEEGQPEGQPEGVAPPVPPAGEPEELMPEPETPEDIIENSENE
jgi:hypothetical protein